MKNYFKLIVYLSISLFFTSCNYRGRNLVWKYPTPSNEILLKAFVEVQGIHVRKEGNGSDVILSEDLNTLNNFQNLLKQKNIEKIPNFYIGSIIKNEFSILGFHNNLIPLGILDGRIEKNFKIKKSESENIKGFIYEYKCHLKYGRYMTPHMVSTAKSDLEIDVSSLTDYKITLIFKDGTKKVYYKRPKKIYFTVDYFSQKYYYDIFAQLL